MVLVLRGVVAGMVLVGLAALAHPARATEAPAHEVPHERREPHPRVHELEDDSHEGTHVQAEPAIPVDLQPMPGGSVPLIDVPPQALPQAGAEPRVLHPDSPYLGEFQRGRFSLWPRLNIQVAGFAEGNAGFDGEWALGPVRDSKLYYEFGSEIGFAARYDLERYGTLLGRASGVVSATGAGLDAAASNAAFLNTHEFTLEDLALSWRSGDLVPSLGHDAIEIAFGNQNYHMFDGLLFWVGATAGGRRGALWISPLTAFREAAIARVHTHGFTAEGFHLKYNDQPNTGTRVGGGRLELKIEGHGVHSSTTGFSYFNIFASDKRTRDGMNGYYLYQGLAPLEQHPDLTFTTSFVAQTNSKAAGLSTAIGYFFAPSYQLSSWPWSPRLTYRYASFSGGQTSAFDPLFAGNSDWGTWFQGELLGEFVLPNSNLRSHMVRVALTPSSKVVVNLFYYKFLLEDLDQAFGVTPKRVASSSLADEVDLIVQVGITPWWEVIGELTTAIPNTGFREAVGGSATWINTMIYTRVHF